MFKSYKTEFSVSGTVPASGSQSNRHTCPAARSKLGRAGIEPHEPHVAAIVQVTEVGRSGARAHAHTHTRAHRLEILEHVPQFPCKNFYSEEKKSWFQIARETVFGFLFFVI